MTREPSRSSEAGASGVWLTTRRKRVVAAVILVIAALSFLVLWDADLLWSARESSIGPGTEVRLALANPAAVSCAEKGGTSEIVSGSNGQTGTCRLPDGRVCEEWALFREARCAPPAETR